MISAVTLEKLEFQKVILQISKYCTTDNGKESVLGILPFENKDDAVMSGLRVNEAKEILIKNDIPPIEYLPNLEEALSKSRIEGTILSTRQILDIFKLAESSRKVYHFLKNKEGEVHHLSSILNQLFVDKVFEHHFTKIFTENGEIKDDASAKLREIRVEIREKEASLRKVVNRMLKQLSESYLVQEEYITQRDGRIVLPVKVEHKRHVRGFIHSESASGQTVYIEPEETLELNNEILSLSFAEKREIEKILKSLTSKIGEQSFALRESLKAISELDSIFARAKYSFEVIGSFPSFEEEKPFHLIDAKHPLLLKKLGNAKTVPMDLKMDESSIVLITGPNAGGKTVTLKTTGLLVLLAQSGIHIPVQPDSNFHFFEKVLVDIGDSQSIEDDLSTFSSHLTNIKNILDEASEKSLVLLDEIGTGTDPAEGAAIATGTLVSLRNQKAYVLATTHHGSLKIIANQMEKFQNASMEFDTDELKPTYKFNQGIPGSSYAFEVASRIGLSDKFIKLSKEYLDTDKTKIEDFLVNLENKSKDIRDQLHKIELENLRLKSLANLYQDKIEKLENQKKEILAETKEKAQIYLSDINKKFENAIKNIKESNAKKEIIKTEKKNIETIKKETEVLFKKEISSHVANFVELKVGDYACIKNTSSVGVIEELNKEKNKAILAVGTIKIKAKYSDLISAKKSEIDKSSFPKSGLILDDASYRLDLRGMRGDEAELEMLRFLDNSNMNGIDRVEILHGKGTGALKLIVQRILKNYPHVKNYYYANIEHGGDGITVVEFK
jgi:DNA mismatch repair protein MutS2